MADYSYFRAEGKSLLVVQMVADAVEELGQFYADLCKKYGASTAYLSSYIEEARPVFVFKPNDKVPDGWDKREQTRHSYDGSGRQEIVCIHASPLPNTADDQYVSMVVDLMQRAKERSRFDTMFGHHELFTKDRPAGEYHSSFVRSGDMKESDIGGYIRDTSISMYASNSPVRSTGPAIHAQKMGDDWYIRVCNDAQGQPVFTPPDAVFVPLDDMLKIDARLTFPPPRKPAGPSR